MSPQIPDKNPIGSLALVPLLAGVALLVLGVLMMAFPGILIEVLVVLLGIPVCLAGIGLVAMGFKLWRNVPDLSKHVRLENWRFWRGGGR